MTKPTTIEELFTAKDPKKIIQGVTFEEALKLLEELVVSVERGALPLDKAIFCYERGVELIEHLREKLSGAEAKLKVLRRGKDGGVEESK